MTRSERLEGYVADQACLRKYPQDELQNRARQHTKACALMGHCVESGYGLMGEKGLVLLDTASTPEIVRTVAASSRDRGIRLRVTREMRDGEMRTVAVEEI